MSENQIAKTDGKIPQNSIDEPKIYEPTKTMLKWFQAAVELGYTASISAVSKKAKVDRKNWYWWIEDIKFVEWWDRQWKKYLSTNRWKLDAIGMKKAEKDYTYWHDMMKRTGNIKPENPSPMFAAQFNNNITSPDSLPESQIDDYLSR